MDGRAGELTFRGPDGERLRGWEVRPAATDPAPGLVLVPDVRGLSAHWRDVTDRFAAAGFRTLAVDLYSREGTPDLPDLDAIVRWMRALPDRRVLADLEAARDVVAARATTVSIAGFCMGGQYALMAACTSSGFAACVSWYGMLRYPETNATKPVSPLDLAPRLGCPYLGLFGEDDALVPMTDVAALRARLAGTDWPTEIVTYPGAGHAFMNDTRREAFRPDAAADSWARAIAFLRRHAGPA